MSPDHDLSANAIADRVNCFTLGDWLDALSDRAGVIMDAPLGAGRTRTDVALVTLGMTVNPNMVGILLCQVFRLGGEIPYHDVERLFGRPRLGC